MSLGNKAEVALGVEREAYFDLICLPARDRVTSDLPQNGNGGVQARAVRVITYGIRMNELVDDPRLVRARWA